MLNVDFPSLQIKGDPIITPTYPFGIPINGKNFLVQEPLIMFLDEKPHELSMKRLTAGVIAVIVVVVVAIIAGIVVLVSIALLIGET